MLGNERVCFIICRYDCSHGDGDQCRHVSRHRRHEAQGTEKVSARRLHFCLTKYANNLYHSKTAEVHEICNECPIVWISERNGLPAYLPVALQ